MELVVAMMISVIVISVGFYAFLLFSKQLGKRQTQAGKLSEYLLFRRTFGRDVERAEAVTDSAEGGPLLLSVDGGALRYTFGEKYILRCSGEAADTFFLRSRAEQEDYMDSLPLIRFLRLKLYVNGDSVELGFHKNYSAEELMQAGNPIHAGNTNNE